MTEREVSCQGCEFEFYIEYDEEVSDIRYCPSCGNELFEELHFED